MDISTLPKPIQGRFLILLWPNTGPVALHQMSRLSHKTTCGWKGQHWSWEGKPSPSRANAWQKTKAAIADSFLPPSTFTQPLDVIEQANSFHRVPVSSTWLFLEISFTFRGCRDTPGSKSVSCQACPGHPSSDSVCPWGQQGLLSLLASHFNRMFTSAVHSSMSLASNKAFAHLEFWKFVTRLPKGKETSWLDVRAEGHKEGDRGFTC